jgi:CDP-4-dehydro-6-deoxyglucose reductase, E1
MTKKKIQALGEIKKIISEHYDEKEQPFLPGKSMIKLISPSYGKEEVCEAIESLLSSWVTMGKKVKKFETMFAKYVGVKYAIMVNSGSSANLLALSTLSNPMINKIKKNDEIITPAVTWATTVFPIINIGATPVFVDVDPESYTLDISKISDAISKKTSAIMPVHLLGGSCDMKNLQKISKTNELSIIEDACEAHGAEFAHKKVGSFGDMSTFSFFMSHHITTIEGGMILTNNEKYYETAKNLRAFGWIRDLKNKEKIAKKYNQIDERFLFNNIGFNIRPTEIQGAFGIHQMKKLEKFVRIRRSNAKFWNKRFNSLKDVFILPKEIPNSKHSYFCYPITIRDDAPFNRNEIMQFLTKRKIETRPIMAGNIVEQPVMKLYKHKISGQLKNSKLIMKNGFFFGNHQDIGLSEREYVSDSVIEFITQKTKM